MSFFEFLEPTFMQRALLVGSCIAIVAPLLGQFMVVRRLSAIPDTISHIALLGIVLGFIVPGNSLLIALLVTVGISLLVEWLRKSEIVSGEMALVLGLVGSLSLVSILQQVFTIRRSLESLLFGSLLTLTWTEAWLAVGVSIIVFMAVIGLYTRLFSLSLGEQLARLQGLRVNVLNSALVIMTALVVAVSVQLVGALLIGSLMVVPVASSLQFEIGFKQTHIFAIIISVVAFWLGIIISWFMNIPPGAAITLINLGIFTLLIALRRLRLL